MKKRIIVFWNQPFTLTQTFIYDQVVGLTRYEAAILGSKLPPKPYTTPPNSLIYYLINQGGVRHLWREVAFKFFGFVPPDVLQWFHSVQPHLIHAHMAPYGAIALALARQSGLPLLVSVHGTDVTMHDRAIWRSSYIAHRLYLLRRRTLARVARRVIVQSDFLRRVVIERHGIPPEKVALVRLGVDLSRFQPSVRPPELGHVLYVGRLIELKGLHYLLQALAQLRDRVPELRLTVIGDGPMRVQYEWQARQLLGDRVTFVGAQPSDVVRAYLERAYLFCMPSVTMPTGQAESLGVVFLEAMAMQVPPISFRSGGIPEVILHGQTGFLAEERDVAGLAHYLELLLTQPALRHQLGEQGRRWVEQEFNLVKQNAKLEEVYDEVMIEQWSDRRMMK